MRTRGPAALLALACLIAPSLRAAEDLPPLGRAVHVETWRDVVSPQMVPLEWESLSYEPRWSGYLGAVILQRARPESTPFVINPVTGDNIFDPSDFVFPFEGGFDVSAVRYGTWADLEFRYFGINGWSASQGPVFSPDGFTLPIPGFDVTLMPVYTESWYDSSLNSVELNLRRRIWPRWSLLAGLRYLSFREELGFIVGDAGFNNATILDFDTQNELYGLQIGACGTLWQPGPRFRVESALKAGVYVDGATAGIHSQAVGGGGGGGGIKWHNDHTAFVGDLAFNGVYQLTEHLAIRGGYQLLWLSGVAIAPEQIHSINFAEGSFHVNTSHGAFFHGALVGLEATW